VGLGLFEHTWMRPHPALRQKRDGLPGGRQYVRRTPAMAIGLSDHAWSWTARGRPSRRRERRLALDGGKEAPHPRQPGEFLTLSIYQ